MQDRFYSASDLKAHARQAIRSDPPTLLMIVFLASLPGLINTTVTTVMQGSSLFSQLYTMMLGITGTETRDQLLAKAGEIITAYYQSSGGIIGGVVQLIAWLITPMLSMGLAAALLKLLRNEQVSAADVLSRRGCFLKAIGLQLMTLLKILLWMVPGMALAVGSVETYVLTKSLELYMSVFFVGIVLMGVLGIRAALHYTLAENIMADKPETGILTAIRESVGCMRTRKMNFAVLYISFIGWMLLSNLVDLELGTSVIGLVLSMVLSLVLSLYMNTAITAFYLQEYCGELPKFQVKTPDESKEL